MLRNPGFPSGKEIAEEVLSRSGISGERRAETLGIEEFASLAACMEEVIFHDRGQG